MKCCTKEMRKFTLVERFYGTRTNKPLSSQHTANQFVRWLLPEERATLFVALKEFKIEEGILEKQEGRKFNYIGCYGSIIDYNSFCQFLGFLF